MACFQVQFVERNGLPAKGWVIGDGLEEVDIVTWWCSGVFSLAISGMLVDVCC